jgi:hypothetical protein
MITKKINKTRSASLKSLRSGGNAASLGHMRGEGLSDGFSHDSTNMHRYRVGIVPER